jgi:hypothetical protein
MESGTAESANGGCKPTHHDGLSAHRAATTTWDGTASASSAASDSIASEESYLTWCVPA